MRRRVIIASVCATVALLSVWYFTRITDADLDDVREVAIRELFTNASPGFAPGKSPKWRYFAIRLEDRSDPSPEFLKRFEDVYPVVFANATARRFESANAFGTKGMYASIESIEVIALGKVQVRASVGGGGVAAGYELVVVRTWSGWKCESLKQTFVS